MKLPQLKKIYYLVLCCMAMPAALSAQEQNTKSATVIESERLEMVTTDEVNTFCFFGNVRIDGEALKTKCDEMMVIAKRAKAEAEPGLGEVGSIAKIIAVGNVVIDQFDRTAKAERAEIFPSKGEVVLMGNPSVTDSQGVVRGYRMVLHKDDRRAEIEGSPEGARPSVTLPALPNLDPRKNKKSRVVYTDDELNEGLVKMDEES
tara:strand:+ start:54050 stop:54661 length:612 start_codon:yes stop_codon:yes gene_type:complete